MNEFECRWKSGAEAARRPAPMSAPSPEAPFGFAARVVAQWQADPESSLAALWQQLALRVLGVMALILIGLAAYGALTANGDSPLQPPVENAVSETCWLL